MKNMENIALDPKIKDVIKPLEWDKVDEDPESQSRDIGDDWGLLEEIGCDYASIMIELLSSSVDHERETRSGTFDFLECLPQPRSSSLSVKQHIRYVALAERFRLLGDSAVVPADDKHHYRDYKALKFKVLCEQEEYRNYAYQNAIRYIQMYDQVLSCTEEYFKLRLALEMQRVQRYMQYYFYLESFSISVVPYTSDPQPSFQNLFIQLGSSPLLHPPEIEADVPYYDFKKIKEVHQLPISEDVDAEKLAKRWKADIVISLSALKTLACNVPPFSREWEIPICVRSLQDQSGENRNVVFIDKALPPKSVNGRDITQRYFKKAVKHFILQTSVAMESEKSMKASMRDKETTEPARMEKESSDTLQEADTYTSDSSNEDDDVPLADIRRAQLSSRKPESELEEEIPQVDGTHDPLDDEEGSSKTEPAARRKTRTSSLPESLTRAADLSIWRRSLSNLPKAGSSTQQRSSLVAFKQWSQKKTIEPSKQTKEISKKSDNSEQCDDSEDESHLVIDSGDEEKKDVTDVVPETDSSTSEDREKNVVADSSHDEDETDTISFKTPSVDSDLIKSLLEIGDGKSSTNHQTANLPLRRSARKRSVPSSDETKPPEAKSSKSNTPRTRKSVDAVAKAPPSSDDALSDASTNSISCNTRSSARSSATKQQEKPSASASDTTLTRRSRSKKSIESITKSAASADTLNDDNIESGKSRRSRSITRVNLANKGKKLLLKVEVKTNVNTPFPVTAKANSSLPAAKQPKVDSTPAAARKYTSAETAKTKTSSSPISVAKEVEVDAAASKKCASEGPENTHSSEHATVALDPTDGEFSEEANETIDVLGQILSMQQGRKEKISTANTDLKTKLSQTDMPVHTLDHEESFDAMMEVHSTELSNKSKGVFYSLWSFGDRRVLVRGCLHGNVQDKIAVTKGDYSTPLMNTAIHTKLEYQPNLCFEQLSPYEACSEWVDLQFRPQPSSVLRCRVCPRTRKLLRVDRVKAVPRTYRHYEVAGFNRFQANKLLLSLFQKLTTKKTYEVGNYLISHKSGAKDFATRKGIVTPSNRTVVYELHREYANPGQFVLCTPQTVPWNPPDPWKQTQQQYNKRRVPMTFDVAAPDTKKKKSKGKKKKKKKKRES